MVAMFPWLLLLLLLPVVAVSVVVVEVGLLRLLSRQQVAGSAPTLAEWYAPSALGAPERLQQK